MGRAQPPPTCHSMTSTLPFSFIPYVYPQKTHRDTKTMKVLHAILVLLFAYTGDGKSSKSSKSSKKGSQANPCFETSAECTEREPSGKGSKGALPYAIWCKEGEREVCRNKEPHSHSIDRYQLGRCGFCGLLYLSRTHSLAKNIP